MSINEKKKGSADVGKETKQLFLFWCCCERNQQNVQNLVSKIHRGKHDLRKKEVIGGICYRSVRPRKHRHLSHNETIGRFLSRERKARSKREQPARVGTGMAIVNHRDEGWLAWREKKKHRQRKTICCGGQFKGRRIPFDRARVGVGGKGSDFI